MAKVHRKVKSTSNSNKNKSNTNAINDYVIRKEGQTEIKQKQRN